MKAKANSDTFQGKKNIYLPITDMVETYCITLNTGSNNAKLFLCQNATCNCNPLVMQSYITKLKKEKE